VLAGGERRRSAGIGMCEAHEIVAMRRHTALEIQPPAAKAAALNDDRAARLTVNSAVTTCDLFLTLRTVFSFMWLMLG
jgi:hypothetical protein